MSANNTQDPTDEKAMADDSASFVEQMRKIASGEAQAPNATVDYLLKKYQETQAELAEAQKQIVAAQDGISRLQGRLMGLEVDLKAWHERPAD